MEWWRRSQRGSRSQQHRGQWGWPDPVWSSTNLQDRQSSRQRTLRLKQEDEGEHVQVNIRLRLRRGYYTVNVADNATSWRGANKWCTSGVTNTAKRAWNWGEAPCWTIMAHRARAILWEFVRALWCRLHRSTLAEVTLQTRT